MMDVHNHGPAEGLGLDCPERRLPDGSLRGACMPAAEPSALADTRESIHDETEVLTLDQQIDAEAEQILFTFLASIPAVRARASVYAQSLGKAVDLLVLTAAARDGSVLDHSNMLALVKASIEKVITRSTVTAEEAWADHSIGMAWNSEEHQYGEYRQFLAGFEYRDGLSA